MSNLESLKNKAKTYIIQGKTAEAINRLFRFDECYAFKKFPDRGFDLLQKISSFFNIPLRSIHIVGSAQLGYSLHNDSEFMPGKSDLDVAIVNTEMFLRYSELCYQITDKYRNLTGFTALGNLPSYEVSKRFSQYLSKGYLRPDYMPKCDEKIKWMNFFERAGDSYLDLFKKITCGIYLSEAFFSSKQEDTINEIQKIL